MCTVPPRNAQRFVNTGKESHYVERQTHIRTLHKYRFLLFNDPYTKKEH
jgi:hypothetical protein